MEEAAQRFQKMLQEAHASSEREVGLLGQKSMDQLKKVEEMFKEGLE
jgi:hypothetical protein